MKANDYRERARDLKDLIARLAAEYPNAREYERKAELAEAVKAHALVVARLCRLQDSVICRAHQLEATS